MFGVNSRLSKPLIRSVLRSLFTYLVTWILWRRKVLYFEILCDCEEDLTADLIYFKYFLTHKTACCAL